MMYDFATSKFRGLRLRLRYYQFFVKKKQKKSVFISDKSRDFANFVIALKNKNYKKIVIVGNGPNISTLDHKTFKHYMQDHSVLIIGLNKTYLHYQTDILLWGDHVIMRDLKDTEELPKMTFLHASQLVKTTRDNLVFWKKEKSFFNYATQGLFKSRTILVSALHLSYLLNIKKVELYGISMDDRTYFYDKISTRTTKPFEFLSENELNKNYLGYTMHKITQEVIEYLASEEFEITYGGESKFLSSVNGINGIGSK